MVKNIKIVLFWYETFFPSIKFLKRRCTNSKASPEPVEKKPSGSDWTLNTGKMYIFPFLCILLSSVAAIDFDSEYSMHYTQQQCKIFGKCSTKRRLRLYRLRLFKIFVLIHLYFHLKLFSLFLTGPSEVFAIIGQNETLACQANEPVVWWSKDNQNLTKTDKR